MPSGIQRRTGDTGTLESKSAVNARSALCRGVCSTPNYTSDGLNLTVRVMGKRAGQGARKTGLLSVYWQLEAIILTESTFSLGALALELAEALVPELVERLDDPPLSTVPVISTLCPTCGVS